MEETPQQPTSRMINDGVSDLQILTRTFVTRVSDLVSEVLIKSSEVKEEGSTDTMNIPEEVWRCVYFDLRNR